MEAADVVVLADLPRAAARPRCAAAHVPAPGEGRAGTPRDHHATVIGAEIARPGSRTSVSSEEPAAITGMPHRPADSPPPERVRAVHRASPLPAALFDLEKTC